MAEMKEPVIVDAVRTPVGKRGKALQDWHPADLLAHTLAALVERTGLDPEMVDDVIAGCVRQVDEQSMNIARNAVLGAGFPESVPLPPSTASAARASRPPTSPPRGS
jgi:acetyl-CoA acyltransferase